MSPRRLLIVSHSLSGGGAERVTSTLLTRLDRARFEPHLVLCTDDPITYPLPPDVPVMQLGQRGLFTVPQTVRRLAAEIDRLRPAVVLSNIDYTTLFTGLALRRTTHRPRWIARLGLNPRRRSFSILDSCARFLLRRLYPRVDRFVANSRGLADCFAADLRVPRAKIDVILNPVDVPAIERQAAEPASLQRAADTPLIVFAGRLHRQKRPEVFVEALRLLAKERPLQGWLLGDGPRRPHVERQIRRAGLSEAVRCLGFQANPFPLLAQADVYVLCSDHEGLPNTLLEAQALGIPAVSTRCPFGPEEIILEGRTGQLVPCGDPDAIAAAVKKLLDDPARHETIPAAARHHIRERFAPEPILEHWHALLDAVAAPD